MAVLEGINIAGTLVYVNWNPNNKRMSSVDWTAPNRPVRVQVFDTTWPGYPDPLFDQIISIAGSENIPGNQQAELDPVGDGESYRIPLNITLKTYAI